MSKSDSNRFSEEDLLKKGFVRDGAGCFVPVPKNASSAKDKHANETNNRLAFTKQSDVRDKSFDVLLQNNIPIDFQKPTPMLERALNQDPFAHNILSANGIMVGPTKDERDRAAKQTSANYAKSFEMMGISSLRRITLCLFGEPMPKQSVRSFATGAKTAKGKHIVSHYQPKEMGQRVADYQKQLRSQLSPDFVMFTEIVHIRKLHFVFSPLKSFGKNKMDRIAKGEIFYKTTKPDLPDNLKKLVMDSLSEIVYKDDALIATESDVAKYYGTGGMILITLEGK